MKEGPIQNLPFIWLILFLLFLLIAFNIMGFRLKQLNLKKHTGLADHSDIQNSLLGLMALLLAFSFGIAASKFESRRQLVIEEANDIGTAILRCDLYPDSTRNELRKEFKIYIEKRVAYYTAGSDINLINKSLEEAGAITNRVWKIISEASKNKDNLVASQLMIPATNACIDIVTTREISRKSKVPPLILYSLLALAWASSFITGYNTKGEARSKLMVLAFVLMTTLTLYLVIELNNPRRGLLNLDSAEVAITSLRSMVP
jgi:hypothetical protein